MERSSPIKIVTLIMPLFPLPKDKARAPASLALLSLTPEEEEASEDGVAGLLDPVAMCSAVQCKRGRECRVLSSGLPDCVCREEGGRQSRQMTLFNERFTNRGCLNAVVKCKQRIAQYTCPFLM